LTTPPFIHIDKMALGSLIMKKQTQKESKKNKKPTKKACKIIQSDSLDGEDLYTAPVRKCNNEDNDEDDEDDDDLKEDQNQKHKNEDNSEDDEDYNEDKEDDPQEDKDSETNSAASLISEKKQCIE